MKTIYALDPQHPTPKWFAGRIGGEVISCATLYKHPDRAVRVLLVPMFHVAEPEFYDEVRHLLEGCSVILTEGVDSRRVGWVVPLLERAMRLGGWGLVGQGRALPWSSLGKRIVPADIADAEFERRWKAEGARAQLFVYLFAPLAAAAIALRPRWVRREAAQWTYVAGPPAAGAPQTKPVSPPRTRMHHLTRRFQLATDRVVLNARNEVLFGALDQTIAEQTESGSVLGVPWGAGHMTAVAAHLEQRHKMTAVERIGLRVWTVDEGRSVVFETWWDRGSSLAAALLSAVQRHRGSAQPG